MEIFVKLITKDSDDVSHMPVKDLLKKTEEIMEAGCNAVAGSEDIFIGYKVSAVPIPKGG